MAAVVLVITLFLTVTRTFLVGDAVFLGGDRGVVVRAARSLHSKTSMASPRSNIGFSRQTPKGAPGAGVSPARTLHRRLVIMHVTAAVSQSAAAAKYLLPVSNTSCVVTHRIFVAFYALFNASVVVFLLAKVNVTNGHRTLAWWETGILWCSRLYGWVYLPLVAVMLGAQFPGIASSEGTFCYNGALEGGTMNPAGDFRTDNAAGLGYFNASVVIAFVLLLVMFVKPLLVRVEGAQSGGAVYRRVVLRNIASAAAIITSYVITTVVVVLALLRESPENNKAAQIRDAALTMSTLATLCLTEITLPLGFTSCVQACCAGTVSGNSTQNPARGGTNKPGTAATTAKTNKVRVHVLEELPPQSP